MKRAAWLAGGVVMVLLLTGALVWSFGEPDLQPHKFSNPVFEPVLADPSVIRGNDGYFYAYGTEDDWGDGSGAKLVPIVRSKDMTAWEYIGDAFAQKPEWHGYGSIWAPDISNHNGLYYLYYSMSSWGDSNPGIGVATSEKPEGPFEDRGALFRSADIGVGNSIDPMRFTDDDGVSYLFWGSFRGIFGVRLSEDGLSVVGEKFHIAGGSYEAAYMIKRDGYYYFFGSRGTCCEGENSGYNVAVGRSESLRGPYVDKDGVKLLASGGTLALIGHFPNQQTSKPVAGPGHNAIITDDNGTDWIVYHGVDMANPYLPDGATRRPLMLDPLVWEDGWPRVKDLTPNMQPQDGPVFR
ncbi:family 43 glycosylhydrolase [Paenibacillus thermotolerans]|uniref:family 43 glycosylhydrolase n=1 Tax=Paenibacillus thermotolerans TaxID=3027807 RepID=UPI002367C19D|nr:MULTISPECIES: family 43 glycosylhydrolase [unclassified Paenibacillus]